MESQSSCMINGIDLSPLTVTTGSYYSATYENGDTFIWNICGTVSNRYCTNYSGTSVCQYNYADEKYYSCGVYVSQYLLRLFSFYYFWKINN